VAPRGVARSKYVGWTDMASAEREPITGVWRRTDPLPSPYKNSSDMYQFQERHLAKVGWTCPPRGDATGGAAIFKVGGQNVISEWSERKKFFSNFFVTFPNVGYEQANNYQYSIH